MSAAQPNSAHLPNQCGSVGAQSLNILMKLPVITAEEANRVVVLGAGASVADGAPVQAHLFRKYAETVRRDHVNRAQAQPSDLQQKDANQLDWP